MTPPTKLACAAAALALLGACKKKEQALLYEPVPVERRDITVSAMAAGSIEPILVVDVKSRATGQILEMRVQTGDIVNRGDTLIKVDRRDPTNTLAQAEADMEVARAQLSNAEAQKRRADQMFAAQLLSEQEHDNTNLSYANAQAQLLRAQVGVQTARDALSDCDVIAPSAGTIIQKNVEVGQVITSASRDVSGGTVLLRMADLNVVQVRALVDETDIGKIQAGMPATITVDAYPNRPFEGAVLKIEPQSTVSQNVTMFAVLVRIPNEQGLLRPGMNADVEVHIGSRTQVLAIPNAALRTQRDVGSAAQVLGIDPKTVDQVLAQADSAAKQDPQAAAGGRTGTAASRGDAQTPPQRTARADAPTAQFGASPEAGGPSLPPGVTREQLGALFQKRQSGQALSAAEQALLTQVMQRRGSTGGRTGGGESGQRRRQFGASSTFQYGGNYIVFVLRNGQPTPVRVGTGFTDMDYSEVLSGLTEKDTVLLLPSASLVAAQDEMKNRMQRMGGGVPGMSAQPTVRVSGGPPPGGPR